MKKYTSVRLLTAGIIMAAAMTATACSKTTTPIDTLPAGAGTPVETSGENLVSTEADKETTKAANKDTTKETSRKAAETTSAPKKDSASTTASNSESTSSSTAATTQTASTKAEETTTTKAVVTETTTQTATEESTTQKPTKTHTTQTETTTQASTEAPTSQTETTTQAPTEKATEKQTETTTQAPTEVPTTQPETTTQAPTTQPETTTQAQTEAPTAQPETTTQAPTEAPAPHVHNYTATVTKAATCAEEGITTYTCSCGDSYTQAIPMTEHSFGDFVYNNDATTDADGTQTRTCSVCGVTDTVTAEGTKKSLPSWYDEHPDIPLNQTRGSQHDGSLEAYWISGQFDWNGAAMGCDAFGYSDATEIVGRFAEGAVVHGYLY